MNRTITLLEDDLHKGPLILLNQQFPLKGRLLIPPLNLIRIDHHYVHTQHQLKDSFLKTIDFIKSDDYIIPFNSKHHTNRKDGDMNVSSPLILEHKIGLAINLKINNRYLEHRRCVFPNSGISRDFKELCVYFGLIQRFTQNKQKITKIKASDFHFRYVGYPHSKIMKDKCLCLEEYLELIKNKHHDTPLYYDDYEIRYLKYEGYPMILSISEYEEFSGNNMDGFILTKKLP